jgi:hypothetical protein
MRLFLALTAVLSLSTATFAQTAAPTAPTPTCKAQASDKKLAGAALSSFMKKCESDAAAACNTTASGQKLAGAAKASFTKKCVSDRVGG